MDTYFIKKQNNENIGPIGGTSWLSKVDYYRIINQEVNHQLDGLHSAKLLLHSVDLDEFITLANEGEWLKITGWFAGIANQLHNAGARAIVLCANTPHLIAKALEQLIQIPIIHIADATVQELRLQSISRTVLLGTKLTIEAAFFKDKLIKPGINVFIPNAEDRNTLIKTKNRTKPYIDCTKSVRFKFWFV